MNARHIMIREASVLTMVHARPETFDDILQRKQLLGATLELRVLLHFPFADFVVLDNGSSTSKAVTQGYIIRRLAYFWYGYLESAPRP